MRSIATLLLSALVVCSFTQISSAQASQGYSSDAHPTRVKIASSYITANGCHDNRQTFTVGIPDAAHLDRSYAGVLSGIEVHETAGNNTHSYSNFGFINNSMAITYQLYAKGAGTWMSSPFGGGGWCAGAAGASEGIDVYAHYKW
jgi:hypothetical protein